MSVASSTALKLSSGPYSPLLKVGLPVRFWNSSDPVSCLSGTCCNGVPGIGDSKCSGVHGVSGRGVGGSETVPSSSSSSMRKAGV